MSEQARRDGGAITAWTHHVGVALLAMLALLGLVVAGVILALVGVRSALNGQASAREREHCTVTLLADANADLFEALVELDRDGNIKRRSSAALVRQARRLDEIDERCR